MNRYFYQCPTCLLRFTADTDQDYSQPKVGACPVCHQHGITCLGATKGVLSYRTPCDDRCTGATGPDCSCSCGGRHHGSGLLVPTIGNIVDLSYQRIKGITQTRADYERYAEQLSTLPAYATHRIRAAKSFGTRMRLIAQQQTRLGITPKYLPIPDYDNTPCLPAGTGFQLKLI